MKSFTEVKYEFGVGVDITTARDGDVVRMTFEETDGGDCKRIRVSMSALCARRAATVLGERARVSAGEESTDDSLGSQVARLRMMLEKAQEKVSRLHIELEDSIGRIKEIQIEHGLDWSG